MTFKYYLSGLLIGMITTAFGCAVPPPDPPDPRLSADEVQDLLKCQHTIKEKGRLFVNTKMRKLEECADEVLELQLRLESELITQEEFDAALPQVRARCVKKFSQIGAHSTELVNDIIAECKPVEEILLEGNDPLLFEGLIEGDFESVDEVAGFICGFKELAVDFMVTTEVPRLHHLLTILGPEFVIEEEPFGTGSFLPNIPLDPRCEFFTPPV